MEQSPLEAQSTYAAPPERKRRNKKVVYAVVAIVVLLLLFLGYKFLFAGSSTPEVNETPSVITPFDTPTDSPEPTSDNSPTPKPTNTPTPKPTVNPVDKTSGLDRSDLTVTIQNGSGEAGVAGKASDILKNLGYGVSGTENADNFDYVDVVIKIKSDSSDFLSLLKSDLSSEYTIGSTSAALDNGFSSDALVIIGK